MSSRHCYGGRQCSNGKTPYNKARAWLFRKWLKMVLSPLQVREEPITARKTNANATPKTAFKPKKRIKTILYQFRNTHARYWKQDFGKYKEFIKK